MAFRSEVWQEMQRDAAPVHIKCPNCINKAADSEVWNLHRLLGFCIEIENNGEWWFWEEQQYECLACNFVFDDPETTQVKHKKRLT